MSSIDHNELFEQYYQNEYDFNTASLSYIILNSKKPLINQIFTAAHEYYHYIKDYQKFKEMPYICDFSMLQDVNEIYTGKNVTIVNTCIKTVMQLQNVDKDRSY